ncbi:MAG: hypothetical protein ACREGB_03375, partial [Candidatus Saccharimonadales bacterium]
MAQSFTTDDGIVLVDPGTYVATTVQSNASNTPTAGVVALIGEAEQGPDFTAEADLSQNFFTPDQFGKVLQKYKSGRLVDGFRGLVNAANDPTIIGAVSQVLMIKTNKSVAASAEIDRAGFGAYADLNAKLFGLDGNLIKWHSLAAAVEAAPNTGLVDYVPHYAVSPYAFNMRTNGSAPFAISIAARLTGPAFVSTVNSYAFGIMATGGLEGLPLSGKAGLTLSAATNTAGNLVVTIQSGNTFATTPAAGDVVVIPSGAFFGAAQASCIVGTGGVNNAGSFIVQSVAATHDSMILKRISADGVGALGSASGTINTDVRDIVSYKPVQIRNITGMDRQATVGMSGQFTIISNDGTNVVLQTPPSTTWTAQPAVGDNAVFATAFGGITAGFYTVTASTSTTVNFARFSNGTAGTTSNPTNIVSPILANAQPFTIQKPAIDGLGKSMEFAGETSAFLKSGGITGGSANLSNILLISSAEYKNAFTVSQNNTTNTYN